MTIELYSGRPGSGKSYHAMRKIRDSLKFKKRDVIANFEVKTDESWKGNFTYLPNSSVTAANLVALSRNYWADRSFKEDGLLLVLDECQLLFNSRTWNQPDRMSFLEFMSQHRKYGYKIIFIAQADIMIDKQFRTLIEYETNHRKLGNYGKFGAVVNAIFLGGVFYACTYYYAQKVKVGGEWFRYSARIASMYDSYTTFDDGQGGTARSVGTPALPEFVIESTNHEIMDGCGLNHEYQANFTGDYDRIGLPAN